MAVRVSVCRRCTPAPALPITTPISSDGTHTRSCVGISAAYLPWLPLNRRAPRSRGLPPAPAPAPDPAASAPPAPPPAPAPVAAVAASALTGAAAGAAASAAPDAAEASIAQRTVHPRLSTHGCVQPSTGLCAACADGQARSASGCCAPATVRRGLAAARTCGPCVRITAHHTSGYRARQQRSTAGLGGQRAHCEFSWRCASPRGCRPLGTPRAKDRKNHSAACAQEVCMSVADRAHRAWWRLQPGFVAPNVAVDVGCLR